MIEPIVRVERASTAWDPFNVTRGYPDRQRTPAGYQPPELVSRFAAKFLAHVDRPAEANLPDAVRACWRWTKPPRADGKYFFHILGRLHPIWRFAYELYVGPVTPGMVIGPACGTRVCVRPIHLGQHPHGHQDTRIPDPIRDDIRDLHFEHGWSASELADRHGISPRSVGRILVTRKP